MDSSHLYQNKFSQIKRIKINHFSSKIWRSMCLINSNAIHHTSEKRIRSRSSVLPITYVGFEIVVHSGKRWHSRYVNPWMVGYKAGEFTWNRRLALFKAKHLRKKRLKNLKNSSKAKK